MTKEQETIENLTNLLKQKNEKQVQITNYDLFENIETVLSMLKEKDKEIEHWKNGFERELEDNRKNTCELLKQDLIIRQKDKQIDLIIEEYEYNARINFKNFCEDELRKDSCIQDCKTCAKHYFEKLAKEKGE